MDNSNNAIQLVPIERQTDKVELDYNFTRDNLIEIINLGKESLDQMSLIANQSQNPRAYEVLSELILTMVHVNKDLLELSRKRNQIQTEIPTEDKDGKVINNNLFVGSTVELQRLMKQLKNKEIDE